jgi:hypothetical protein
VKKALFSLLVLSASAALLQFPDTRAFLLGEKKNVSAISLGANEDVFRTETTEINLKTTVRKKVKITRTAGTDEAPGSETKESSTSVENGSQTVLFIPQRTRLTLTSDQFTFTGEVEGAANVQVAEGEDGIEVRVTHAKSAVEYRSSRLSGEMHVLALGGFYDVTIPITITTDYEEHTEVVEAAPPKRPAPGAPGPAVPPTEEPPLPSDPQLPNPPGSTEPPAGPETPPSNPPGSTEPPAGPETPPSNPPGPTEPPAGPETPPSNPPGPTEPATDPKPEQQVPPSGNSGSEGPGDKNGPEDSKPNDSEGSSSPSHETEKSSGPEKKESESGSSSRTEKPESASHGDEKNHTEV